MCIRDRFCKAVVLTTLLSLDISNCNISDRELVLLGKRIRINWLLQHLSIYGNPFTHSGLSTFLKLFVQNPYSRLTYLGLDLQLNKDQKQTLREINQFRDSLRYPRLNPISYRDTPHFHQEVYATHMLEQLHKDKNDGDF